MKVWASHFLEVITWAWGFPVGEAYSEPYQTSKMELLLKIGYGFQPLTIFAKSFILDVLADPKYASKWGTVLPKNPLGKPCPFKLYSVHINSSV